MNLVSTLEEPIQKELSFFMGKDKSIDFKDLIYDAPEDNIESPRDTSKKILNTIVKRNPYILGGSADLFAANKTYIEDEGNFSRENYLGKNRCSF
jgi:transketolase